MVRRRNNSPGGDSNGANGLLAADLLHACNVAGMWSRVHAVWRGLAGFSMNAHADEAADERQPAS